MSLERDEEDKFRAFAQLEHLHAKYTGTGHADITRHEWAVHQHRDSYAAYIAHTPLLAYMAIAQNESMERCRYNMLTKMIRPCGPKPKEADLIERVKQDADRLKKAEEMVAKKK